MQEKEYTWCFACGKDNPIGFKMEFTPENRCHPRGWLPWRWRSDQRLTG